MKTVLFLFQTLGASVSGSDFSYMVVFQYGSIVLFNIREDEVDGYLKIVEKHASGLLPEMRKDGKKFKCISTGVIIIVLIGGGCSDIKR